MFNNFLFHLFLFSSNIFFSCRLDQRCLFIDTGLSYSQTFPQDTISLASLKKLSPVFSEIKGRKGPAGQNNDFPISVPPVARHWPFNSQWAPRASWPLDTLCPALFMYVLLVIPWSEHTKHVYLAIRSNRIKTAATFSDWHLGGVLSLDSWHHHPSTWV